MENEVIQQLDSINQGLQIDIYACCILIGFLLRGILQDIKEYFNL